MRDALRWLDRLDEPAAVEVMGTGDADVIGYARDGDDAVGVLIRVRGGRVVGREHRFLEGVEEEEDSAVLSAFLVRYYVPAEGRVRRLVIPFPPDEWDTLRELLPDTDWLVPQRGTAQRGWLWPIRMPGTCWRASASSRSRPKNGPRIRSMRWDATSA